MAAHVQSIYAINKIVIKSRKKLKQEYIWQRTFTLSQSFSCTAM